MLSYPILPLLVSFQIKWPFIKYKLYLSTIMYLEVSILNFHVPLDGKMATKVVEIIEMDKVLHSFTLLHIYFIFYIVDTNIWSL